MGAKRSRRSRSVSADRDRYGISRPRNVRPTLPVVVVVCDDARTSVAYFTLLKRIVKARLTLRVECTPFDRAAPKDVIEHAIWHQRALREPEEHDEGDRQVVWALIDLEARPERVHAAYEAQRYGLGKGLRVALSKPCYELWSLLHLVDTGEAFADCGAVLTRLEHEWKKEFAEPLGSKAQADYSKIIGLRDTAVANAKSHREANDPSWTEVYQVLESISDLSMSPP